MRLALRYLPLRMMRLVAILTILLLACCTPSGKLEGVWYLAYTQTDSNKPEPSLQRVLFEFKGESVNLVSIGDFSTGDLGAINIEQGKYILTDASLTIGSKDQMQFGIIISKDSLILTSKEIPNHSTVLRRIDPSLQNSHVEAECFIGSYLIQGNNYEDSIEFINDSIVLHTGKYNANFPADKWEIITYADFSFLNIHDELSPLTVIKSCSAKGVILESPTNTNGTITLTPIKATKNASIFYGKWIEIEQDNSRPLPPLPPGSKKEDRLLHIEFSKDSIIVNNYKGNKKMPWGLSNDGKRIYFMEKILKNEGSWKVLGITEDTLTLRISSHSGFREDIVKLKKERNGR